MEHTAFVGISDGHRVFVSMRYEQIDRTMTDIEHRAVNGGVRISFSGSMHNGFGQILPSVAEILDPAPGWTMDDVTSVCMIWDRWHLNDMHAECAHMPRDRFVGHTECPETGYKFGSAWLYEDPPPSILHEMDRLASLPSGRVPDWAR